MKPLRDLTDLRDLLLALALVMGIVSLFRHQTQADFIEQILLAAAMIFLAGGLATTILVAINKAISND